MPISLVSLEIISAREIDSIISIDAPQLTSNFSSFLSKNKLNYYICVNTWLLIIKDHSQYGWMRVRDCILTQGLINMIKRADDTASQLIHCQNLTDPLWSSIINDIGQPYFGWGFIRPEGELKNDSLATSLSILRYPKRFSPIGNDKVQQNSLADFTNFENRAKLIQRRERPYWIIQELKECCSTLLDWKNLTARIADVLNSKSFLSQTSGSTRDVGPVLKDKIFRMSQSIPGVISEPLGIPYTGQWIQHEDNIYTGCKCVSVQAVPKTYKASRIIAMEDTVRQAVSHAVADVIDHYLPAEIPLHDQTMNQGYAFEGSLGGYYATIDLSHASDCITKSLFREIFPWDFVSLIDPLLSDYTQIDNGPMRTMQMMSTAGNSLTFILESIVFLVITKVAMTVTKRFGKDLMPFQSPSVYGDDIIIDSQCAEVLIQILTKLGFIVNESKSFISGPFRESCGKEFYNGIDVSSIYYPRFPIQGSMTNTYQIRFSSAIQRDGFTNEIFDSLYRVINLQHRLFNWCYPASRFLFELVKVGKPSMTVSRIGSICSDLWEYEEEYKLLCAPGADQINDITRREGHMVPITYFMMPNSKDDEAVRLFEVYRYQLFLKYGPRFDSSLLKLLNCSVTCLNYNSFVGKPTIKWVIRG